MNQYRRLKEVQQQEIDAVLDKYAFFAFNKRQFEDGVAKLGVKDKAGSLVPIGNTGGYILIDKAPELMSLLARHRQELQLIPRLPLICLCMSLLIMNTASRAQMPTHLTHWDIRGRT